MNCPIHLDAVAQTERIIVRPWHLTEADRLFDVLPRPEVVNWLGSTACPMTHRDEAIARIDEWEAVSAADPRFGAWAAVERESGIPVGTVLLRPVPGGDSEVEIGWHFHPDS